MPPSKRGLGGSLFSSSALPSSRYEKGVQDDVMEEGDADVGRREEMGGKDHPMFVSSFARAGLTQITKPMSPIKRGVFQDKKVPSPGRYYTFYFLHYLDSIFQ